jgi:hypothetical protein
MFDSSLLLYLLRGDTLELLLDTKLTQTLLVDFLGE